jgi:hypothetical protein
MVKDEHNGCNVTAFECVKFRYHCIPCQAAYGSKDQKPCTNPSAAVIAQGTHYCLHNRSITRAPLVGAQRLPAFGPSTPSRKSHQTIGSAQVRECSASSSFNPVRINQSFRPPFERTDNPAPIPHNVYRLRPITGGLYAGCGPT